MRTRAVVLLLCLLCAPAAAAPKRTVLALLDAQGNARIHFTDILRTRGPLGQAELIGNLLDGIAVAKAVIRTDADLEGQVRVDATATRVRGSAAMEMPAQPGLSVDVDVTSRRDPEASRATGSWKGHFATAMPAMPLQHFSLGARSAGTMQRQKGGVDLALGGTMIGIYLPAHDFRLTITEGDDVVDAEAILRAPGDNAAGKLLERLLDGAEKGTAQARAHLEKAGARVDVLAVEALPLEGGETGARIVLRMGQTREALRKRVAEALKDLSGASIDDLLGLRVRSLRIQSVGAGDRYDAGVAYDLDGLGRFLIGYIDLVGWLSQNLPQPGGHRDETTASLLRAQMEQVRPLLVDMLAAEDRSAMRFETSLDMRGDGIRVTGGLDFSAGMRGIVSAAHKHAYPLVENARFALTVTTDEEHIRGRVAFDADGPWVAALRDPYAKSMAEVKELAPLGRAIGGVDLTRAALLVTFHEGRLGVDAYLETSGLPALVSALLSSPVGGPPGTPTGIEARWTKRSREQASTTVDLYWSGIPSRKALSIELKRMLGAAKLEVRPAAPAQVAAPSGLQPGLEMP